MKLYCINYRKRNPTTISLLEDACSKNGIEFVLIDSDKYNFAKPLKLERGSILYQLSADETSRSVFRTLVSDAVATIFFSSRDAWDYKDKIATIIHERLGLRVIKSIYDLPVNKQLLKEYVDYLGGFPIIIKAQGGSHGVGVIRADSFESLASIADYLRSNNPNYYIMRQYIDYVDHARLIVLGNKVIDSIKYHKVQNDFRSNAGSQLNVEQKKFAPHVEDTAIKAVKALNAEFGGVDILIDKDGNGLLAEVNIPCYFPRTQMTTGVDIASQLVIFLKEKAEKLS